MKQDKLKKRLQVLKELRTHTRKACKIFPLSNSAYGLQYDILREIKIVNKEIKGRLKWNKVNMKYT